MRQLPRCMVRNLSKILLLQDSQTNVFGVTDTELRVEERLGSKLAEVSVGEGKSSSSCSGKTGSSKGTKSEISSHGHKGHNYDSHISYYPLI